MKKSTIRRLLVLCLCLTMVSASLVGVTLAKYTTSGKGTDSARVAKWGVTVTATGSTFAKEYAKTDTAVSAITNSVVATDDKVVAPGTSGTMATTAISGTPEVAVEVTYSADIELENWNVGSEFYCPIVFKVGSETIQQDATNNTAELLEKAIEAAIAKYSMSYNAGTNLSTATALDVSWSWPYSTGDTNDTKDTALGNAATAATITLDVTTTVTQID